MDRTTERAVIGVFDDRDRVRDAISALQEAGFSLDDVSVIMRDRDDEETALERGGTHVDKTTAAGALAGGVLGGAAGWLAALGLVAVPGLGPLVGAGVVATTLLGMGIGAGAGAVVGALVELGVPESEARWYDREVQGGRVLVAVRADGRAEEARRVLRHYGAYDVDTADARAVGAPYRGFPFTAT